MFSPRPFVSSSSPSPRYRSVQSSPRGPWRLLVLAVWLSLATACVLDRTGQSRTLNLQQDLAQTHAQVQGLQRQMDDQLSRTSARLVEVEENAQLSRRNMADSGALLDTMVSEMQALRGTFEEINQRVSQNDLRSEKLQEDLDFRLQEIEKRLVALEKTLAALPATVTAPPAAGTVPGPEVGETGEQLSAEDTLNRARTYFESGNYKTSLAFLRGFKKRFPSSPQREDAQFLLAESLFRDGDPKSAIQEYQVLIEEFPRSTRIPAVMLRQGEAFLALNAREDAEIFFSELIRAYPKAPEAETARARLKELQP